MPSLIVTTCGTSLLTNNAPPPIKDLLLATANLVEGDIGSDQLAVIRDRIADRESALRTADLAAAKEMSAEISGIAAHYGGRVKAGSGVPDHHLLICSKTYQGQATGRLVEGWLQLQGYNVETLVVDGLTTKEPIGFRSALTDLTRSIGPLSEAYHEKGYRILFNTTGGFKAVSGFMQVLGMFYADECIYIFERSDQLLRIPRLPVKLDPDDVVGKHLDLFRRMAVLGHHLPRSQVAGLAETLLDEIQDQVFLSPWGQVVWEGARDRSYASGLAAELTSKYRYSESFRRDADALLPKQPDRMVLLNQRLDQLAVYLDSDRTRNPPSLDVKELKGNPRPPSTHEFDAWSDKDARRCFGHYEDGVFVIDRLDRGLH